MAVKLAKLLEVANVQPLLTGLLAQSWLCWVSENLSETYIIHVVWSCVPFVMGFTPSHHPSH